MNTVGLNPDSKYVILGLYNYMEQLRMKKSLGKKILPNKIFLGKIHQIQHRLRRNEEMLVQHLE